MTAEMTNDNVIPRIYLLLNNIFIFEFLDCYSDFSIVIHSHSNIREMIINLKIASAFEEPKC